MFLEISIDVNDQECSRRQPFSSSPNAKLVVHEPNLMVV